MAIVFRIRVNLVIYRIWQCIVLIELQSGLNSMNKCNFVAPQSVLNPNWHPAARGFNLSRVFSALIFICVRVQARSMQPLFKGEMLTKLNLWFAQSSWLTSARSIVAVVSWRNECGKQHHITLSSCWSVICHKSFSRHTFLYFGNTEFTSTDMIMLRMKRPLMW